MPFNSGLHGCEATPHSGGRMLHSHRESLVQELAETARQIRLDVLDMDIAGRPAIREARFQPPRSWPACTFIGSRSIRRARCGKGARDTVVQTGPDTESIGDACGLSVDEIVAAVKRALKRKR